MSTTLRLPPGIQVLERGWLSSNNVVLQDADSCALVDSGYLTHAPQTLALLSHALQGRQLDVLLNTHLHSDHCGGNALLQQEHACQTWVPVQEMDAVQQWDEQRLSFQATGQQCARFQCDGGLQHGQRWQLAGLTWDVIQAPGHDPHSIMLYCAGEGILISADALWENGFGVIFPELEGGSGFAEQAQVLALIADLNPRIVIPGHGQPFTDVSAALQRARGRLDYLSAQPQRNARNALKVLIAFMLLDQRQITLAQLNLQLFNSRLMQAAACQLLPADQSLDAAWVEDLLAQLAAELVSAGVAKLEAGCLISC